VIGQGPASYSQQAALDAVRALAQQDAKLHVLIRRDPALHRSILQHFGGLADAKRIAGLRDAPRPRRKTWSMARIVRELQRLQSARVRLTVRALMDAGHHDLLGAISRFVGSIEEARRLARVPEPAPPPKTFSRWDVERVVDEIQQLHRRGSSLAYTKVPQDLTTAAARCCGSWKEAVEAAGLDYESIRLIRPAWTKAELRVELQLLAKSHPRWTWRQLRRASIVASAERAFGSIEAGLRSAGVRDWPRRLVQPRPDKREVIRMIRARHLAGAPMNADAVAGSDNRLNGAARLHFGTWDAALEAAGVPSARKIGSRRSREQVVAELLERFDRGGDLASTAVAKENPSLYHAATRRFGSYATALRAVQRARRLRR